MELSNSLRIVIKDFGVQILSSPKLVNILSDYNSFKDDPASKYILKTAISSNYLQKFLKSGKFDMHVEFLISNFIRDFGLNHDNVLYVFRSVAEALDWEMQSYNVLTQSEISNSHDSLREEALNLLKSGCIICKKDNQVVLLTLDGKKSIPSTIPFDFVEIVTEGFLINKSSVFGYEPYDLLYCFECCGGLVRSKYLDILELEESDQYTYHEKYGFNNQGLVSFDGDTIVPFEYSYLSPIKDGVFYGVIENGDNKYARVVNSKGKILLDNIEIGWNPWNDNLKNGIIEYKDNGVTAYINTSGERIFQHYDYVSFTKSGKFVTVHKNGKSGVTDSNGNIIISPIFDNCFIYENCSIILAKLGNKYGLFDIAGFCLSNFEYDNINVHPNYYVIIVKKDKLYGALNMQGDEIIPCEFEDLKISLEGVYFVEKDSLSGRYGVFDYTYSTSPNDGRMVIPCIFDSFNIYSALIAKKDGLYGMYGFNGRKIVDCKYKELSTCINGTSLFVDEKERGIISSHDRELFRLSKYRYRFIQSYANNNRHIAVKSELNGNGKYGLLDARGNEVTEFIYDGLEHISYGLTIASKKIHNNYTNNYAHGLINSYGDVILPIEYKDIKCISPKVFKVEVTYNKCFCCNENGEKIIDDFTNLFVIGNLIFISRQADQPSSNKYHYQIFDKTGKMANSHVYDQIGDEYMDKFSFGLLKVIRNNKVGFINEYGIEVIPCIYDDARIAVMSK